VNSAGVQPLSPEELRRSRRAAIGGLPRDVKDAFRWLRGRVATSPLLPLMIRRALLRLGGVQLGAVVRGLDLCRFESEHISIGDGAYVNAGCWFEGHGRIDIGRDALIGPEVMFVTSTHAYGPQGEVSRAPAYGEVHVGDRCWLGARVTVLSGVTIGEGTVIAAGAVVTKDCDSGAVYGGVPARRIR
jgi:maltose O-acetyltransferase